MFLFSELLVAGRRGWAEQEVRFGITMVMMTMMMVVIMMMTMMMVVIMMATMVMMILVISSS